MIDINTEELLTFATAAERLPSGKSNKRVHISTIHRWAARPIQGAKLESLRIGGVRYTSVEALARFIEACNQDSTGPVTRTTTRRQRDHDKATRELTEAGI